MRLSHSDFDALQRAILDLHDLRGRETFRRGATAIFLALIPADYFGVFDFRLQPATKQVGMLDYWESSPRFDANVRERSQRFGFDHPFTTYSREHPVPAALMFSDFFTLRQFRHMRLYREFYYHAHIGRLLAIPSPMRDGLATINLGRRVNERDFTERDRLLLRLMRPHYEQARRNAELDQDRTRTPATPFAAYRLTPREAEIALWLGQGKTNPEIATILHMQARTVEKHVERILVKLAVENRTAAALVIADADGRPDPDSGRNGKRTR